MGRSSLLVGGIFCGASLVACTSPLGADSEGASEGQREVDEEFVGNDGGQLPSTETPGGATLGNGSGAPGTQGTAATGGGSADGQPPLGTGGDTADQGAGSGGLASSSGGMTSSGGTDANGSGGQVSPPCEYPAGPYARVRDLEIGDVLPPDLSWTGYDLDGNWRMVTSEELLDCDGSRGRNAIVLRSVAAWCGVCESMNRKLNDVLASGWEADGVAVYVLLAEDTDGNEATDAYTQIYRDVFNPDGWALLTDPDWTAMRIAGGGALPMQVVIDPRTMKIEGTSKGRTDSPPGLEEVLGRNR